MTTELRAAVSQALTESASESTQQASSVAARQWSGLCVTCCLALNWPLSMVNLAAVKVSLLSTYVRPLRAESSGAASESSADEWRMFALKAVQDLRRDSERMQKNMAWRWTRWIWASSLTRRIYSSRRMLLRSQKQSLHGLKG